MMKSTYDRTHGDASLNQTYLTTNPMSLPLGWGNDSDSLGPMIMDSLVKQTIRVYDTIAHPRLSLAESSALELLRKINTEAFDIMDMPAFSYYQHLPLFKFSKKQDRVNWNSIITLYRTWFINSPVYDSWIKANDSTKFYLDDLDKFSSPASRQHANTFLVRQVESPTPFCSTLEEIGRVIRFENGCVVRHHAALDKITVEIDRSFLLMLAGDVESNPGPVMSKFRDEDKEKKQYQKVKQLEKEVAKLRKAQTKQNNFIQRQIELEKRDRQKNRKEVSDNKRYAEGLISDIRTSASDLATNLGPTMHMAQEAFASLLGAGEELRNIFKIPNEYDVLGVLISISSICSALTEKKLLNVTMHCIQLARQLGVTLSDIVNLVPTIEEEEISFRGVSTLSSAYPDHLVAHSLVTDMFKTATTQTQLLPFAGFMAFALGIFDLLCSGDVPSPVTMSKHFAAVGRAAQGFRSVKDLFTWITDYFSQLYYTTVYGLTEEEYLFMDQFPQLEKIYAASKIVDELTRTEIDASASIANQILSMNNQLNDYAYQASKMNSRPNQTLISTIQRRIKDKVEFAQHSPARSHTIRTEPTAFYLYGHPGVGKTVMTAVLKARIFRKYLLNKGIKFESCSFARHAKNEFWEGYTGQPIIELDDFGNIIDSQMKPVEEYEELEYMVNTAQYPLKMAELKSKGVTNFTSDFILASSNQLYPEIKHLTDPGAVFRRFHVWAEVVINPKFGRAIGKDKMGLPYYSFDKEAAAEHLGKNPEDIPPLMTEHYRINLYSVSHNKQTGTADVKKISGKQQISFDEFWEYCTEKYDARKASNEKLANAIREEAGIATPEAPNTEQVIMDKFDKIFNPEKFLKAVADQTDTFVDAESEDGKEDEEFGCIDSFAEKHNHLADLTARFNTYRTTFHDKLTTLYSQLKKTAQAIGNKFLTIAQFLLSFFRNLTSKTYDYLPSVPTAAILASVCATLVAVMGVWYTGLFCSQPSDNCNSWCEFACSPSNISAPCGLCKPCKIVDYPEQGNMCYHFLDRIAVKQVRKELLDCGLDEDILTSTVHRLWKDRLTAAEEVPYAEARIYDTQPAATKSSSYAQNVSEQCSILRLASEGFVAREFQDSFYVIGHLCKKNCDFCPQWRKETHHLTDAQHCMEFANRVVDAARPSSQRAYDTHPATVRSRNFAQRTYDPNPVVAKHTRFAHGYVDAVTPIHIGCVKYAQRDRVRIEQTTQTLLNNSVWIQAVDGNGMASRSNGVFLVGRTMITTAHTVLNPPVEDPIQTLIIRNPYSDIPAISVPYKDCRISQLKQLDGSPLDLALISFPPVVPSRPRIISKFIDANSLDFLKEGSMVFSGFYEINNRTIVQEKHPASFSVSTKATEYYLHPPGTCPKNKDMCTCPIRIGNHIDYDLETQKGMCGALLSIQNSLIHSKLIGFHVAGGAGALALGALTTRQLLESALKEHVEAFGIPKQYLIDGRLPYTQSWVDPAYQASLLSVGDCLSIGTARAPTAPVKTQLAPSLIFDQVQEHVTKPAFLRPVMVDDELVDPMEKGIKKIMGGQTYIDSDLLEIAAHDVFQGFGLPQNGTGIVHSYEEAIVGVEGDPYKRPINRTTSPGYPYNLNNKHKGKTAFLGSDETYILDHPVLKADVLELLDNSRKGIRGSAISLATLKDEKRPIAKVDAGKTRVFEACPQHLVIAIRQYFLDFSAHIMRNRIDNGIAVGINPYSLEWTKLAHRLLEKGNHMIAGDFSNFDGSLLMQILVKICDKINEWYGDGPENALIRSTLWEHLCNADVLVKGEVIRQTHSQPSGNPLTVIINSIFNAIVMRIAYLKLKKEQGLPGTCDYRKHVNEIIYGDDDIKSVSADVLGWFNQLTITDALASFGLTYTDETKTGNILPWKTLQETAFLKRKFVIQNDGTFMAPMEIENILEITNWIRGKAKRASTIENCDQALMELALHPKQQYDYWSNRIREELRKVEINYFTPTWFEKMEEYRYNRDLYDRTEYVPLW